MQPEARKVPFITITALAKYLAYGDKACGYAGWFLAHYTYSKPQFDNPNYLLDHEALILRHANILRVSGMTVEVEDDNSFIARGRVSGIKVAGRPDVVGLMLADQRGLVLDVKTGSPRPEHAVQVRLYTLFASEIPLVKAQIARGSKPTFDAVVIYRNGTEALVPPPDQEFRNQVRDAIAAFAGDTQLATTPSLSNCTFCTIPGCASRFDPDVAVAANDIFE